VRRLVPLFVVVLLVIPQLWAQEKAAQSDEKAQDSTIVFYREKHFTGSALKPSIYVDDKEIDRLSNGRWLSVSVPPGKQSLSSSAKNQAHTLIETSAGETVYVQMIIATGTWRGGGRLIQVDATEAKDKIAKLKPLH
jgi:hypothetical protein